MKRLLLVLTASLLISPIVHAKELKSEVVHWDMLTAKKQDGQNYRPILDGSTLDLESLEVCANTMPVSAVKLTQVGDDAAEKLFIVKEGKIRLTIGGKTDVLVPGSLAILHPTTEYVIENADAVPVTYYLFNFISKDGFKIDPDDNGPGAFMVNWDDLEYLPSEIGGRRNNFDCPTSMMNQFEFHTSTLNAGLTNHKAHTHRAEEMVLVLKGKVEMLIGDTYFTATEGDVFFIEAEILHSLRNIGDESTEYFAFQWM